MAWWNFWKPKTKRREFKAANVNRLNFGFSTHPKTLDRDLNESLPQITARARWLAQNDDYVRRFLKVAKNNIVGPRGVELRAQYNERGTPYKSAIDAVEMAFKDWGQDCEVSGRLNWLECQNLFVEHIARDGEGIVLLQSRGRYGLQLQFIDPMNLAHNLSEVRNGTEIVMGVEIDSFRRPVAYWFHVQDTNQPDIYEFQSRKYQRVPADMVIHAYRQEQVNQVRGFTPLASAIQRLKMLNGYEEAALVAARAGAARMGFYTQDGDIGFEADDEDAEGNLISDFEAGSMQKLPRGWSVQAFETNWPNVDHSDYVKSVLRGIASGIGVSYNTLANDLEGVNFSSIRAGVLEDREEWKGAQQWLADNLHQPVFDRWLDNALTLGLIQIGGNTFQTARYEQFRKVTWQGRRWDWVDPLKDIKANTAAIDYRLKSISDVIREQGRDPDEVFAEIQRDEDRLRELGIEVMRNGNNLQDSEPADAGG